MRKGRNYENFICRSGKDSGETINYRFEWMAGELEGVNLRASRIQDKYRVRHKTLENRITNYVDVAESVYAHV